MISSWQRLYTSRKARNSNFINQIIFQNRPKFSGILNKSKKKTTETMTEETTSSHDGSSNEMQQYGSSTSKNKNPYLTTRLMANRLNDDYKELLTEFGMSSINLDFFEGSLVEDEEIEEKMDESIDRIQYYRNYNKLIEDFEREKIKNNYLEWKMCEYYKKRLMFYVLQPQRKQQQNDKQQRYEDKLDQLEILENLYKQQEQINNSEIDRLTDEFEQKLQVFNDIFESYETILTEIGINLLPKPKLDRLLRQQRQQLKNLTEIRLKSIKLHNRIKEKDDELKAYGDFYKYEQLQTNNRTLSDRLQHIEDDLMRIRQQCNDTLQKLAHKREKSVILDDNLHKYQQDYEHIEYKYRNVREKLNCLQNQRKSYYQIVDQKRANSF